jgi:hypothetical protein
MIYPSGFEEFSKVVFDKYIRKVMWDITVQSHPRIEKTPSTKSQIAKKFQIQIFNFQNKKNHESTKRLKHENRKDKFRAFKISCFRDEVLFYRTLLIFIF